MSMYLDGLRNDVLLFTDPVWSGEDTIASTIVRNLTALWKNIAYSDSTSLNLTVLTPKYSETANGILQGLLYVPDLDPDSLCANYSRQYVPDTAVRQVDLPPTDYNLIALAPWFNNTCTREFLDSAVSDPLRAFIFYLPVGDSSKPPSVDSGAWDLGDGGAWRKSHHYPIFAVSSALGIEMMTELSLYSGNVSEVPNGANISRTYCPNSYAYARIWTQLTVRTPTALPNVWEFVLIVIGVLLAVFVFTVLLMHAIWRRRRFSLRRRVLSGEVNLERMNIQRVCVPSDHVVSFQLFTYSYDPPALPDPVLLVAEGIVVQATCEDAKGHVEGDMDYQPTCQICLVDFVNRDTIIRELPCGHIFHPGCIDAFLCEISSLCPLCKASMLPLGYCPRITNAMVRRERALRRLRERIEVDMTDDESVQHSHSRKWATFRNRFLSTASATERIHVEPASPPELVPQDSRRPAGVSEATLQRMRQLAQADGGMEETQIPQWKAVRQKVFPGFRC